MRHRYRSRTRKAGRLAGIILVLAAVVAGAQEAARQWTRHKLAGDAVFASAGTHDLRLHCTGAGETTYILEAGATGFAESWAWVQDALDDKARVCSYDRAGMGLSDPAPQGFDPARTAQDLRAALAYAGETGPFVMVGHSLGGLLVRDFATEFRKDTAALVLVDPSHERQLDVFGDDMVAEFRAFPDLLDALSAISAAGLLRLWNPLEAGAAGLEGKAFAVAGAFAGDRVHLATSAEELRNWYQITARTAAHPPPADLPLLVVTAGSPVPGSADFSHLVEPLHRELAARSSIGQHVTIEEADHFSIIMDRVNARKLAELIDGYFRSHAE